jgi:hypothetical protein
MVSLAVCTLGSEWKSESFSEYLPSPLGMSGIPATRALPLPAAIRFTWEP